MASDRWCGPVLRTWVTFSSASVVTARAWTEFVRSLNTFLNLPKEEHRTFVLRKTAFPWSRLFPARRPPVHRSFTPAAEIRADSSNLRPIGRGLTGLRPNRASAHRTVRVRCWPTPEGSRGAVVGSRLPEIAPPIRCTSSARSRRSRAPQIAVYRPWGSGRVLIVGLIVKNTCTRYILKSLRIPFGM